MATNNNNNNKFLFIVENGYNTCYISSLLMSLFYKPSYLDNILNCDPKSACYFYLQDIIKIKFVDNVRKNISVSAEIMNEIRNYCNICGWKNENINEIINQQDVNEFYTFIIDAMNIYPIEIQRHTITEALSNENDTGRIEKIPFINLTIPTQDNLTNTKDNNILKKKEDNKKDELSVKELLNNWLNHNIVDIKREIINDFGEKEIKYVKALNIYKVMNVPLFVAISINRFSSIESKKNKIKIDIKKKIKLHNTGENKGIKWKIHSIICHKGETIRTGHYYSIIFGSDNKWLIFDDLIIPSLKQVNIKDTAIMNKIKEECVFLIYTYDG